MGRMNPSARKIFWSRGLRGASACLCMKYNFHQLLDCSKYVQALHEELLKDVKGVHYISSLLTLATMPISGCVLQRSTRRCGLWGRRMLTKR